MSIFLKKNGITKELATGFSFKYFLFGAFYVWAKQGFGKACKHSILTMVTLSVYYWIQCFKYNKSCIEDLILEGYEPLELKDETYLMTKLNYVA